MAESTVSVEAVIKPARKVLVKRGVSADNYFDYCEEVGCDVWDDLSKMDFRVGEPVSLWLPSSLRSEGTSEYVQGVEVPLDYAGEVPAGYDVILLPQAEYLVFQGEPYVDANFMEAIGELQSYMNTFDPSTKGYRWDDTNPRIQLEPLGERGYIEMRAVVGM